MFKQNFSSTLSGVVCLILLSLASIDIYAGATDTGQYIKAKAYLDVRSGQWVYNPVLVIKNQKIESISRDKSVKHLPAEQLIDLSDLYLLPGLMDMHVHLTSDPSVPRSQRFSDSIPRKAIKAAHFAQKTLLAGFTTVRNLGAHGYSVIAVRDGINAGEIPGPRIWSSGPSLGITGGHCDYNRVPPELNYSAMGVADGPWQAIQKVRENIRYGANVIKFCATGGVFSKGTKVGVQQYSLKEMQAIVEEAHRRGVTVAAHAHGTKGIKTAIRAGVDSVEHASFLDEQAIQLAKKHQTWLSMDIYNTEYTLTFGEKNGVAEENLAKERLVSKRQRDSFRRAVKAGLNLVFGSDAAIYPHGDNAKQFVTMVDYGMTPLQAIQAATINSAALLKQQKHLGQIKSGMHADIIGVTADPLRRIEVLQQVDFVMKAGVVYKHLGK